MHVPDLDGALKSVALEINPQNGSLLQKNFESVTLSVTRRQQSKN